MLNQKELKEENRFFIGAEQLDKAASQLSVARYTIRKEIALMGNSASIIEAMAIANDYQFCSAQGKQEFKRAISLGMYLNDSSVTAVWKLNTATLYTLQEGETVNSKGKVVKAKQATPNPTVKDNTDEPETVPATQLQASQAATAKAQNEVDSLKAFAKKTAQEHHKIVAQTEQDAEELNAQLKGQVKQLREKNKTLQVALDRLTHEKYETVKMVKYYKEELEELRTSINSSATRKELKEQVNG